MIDQELMPSRLNDQTRTTDQTTKTPRREWTARMATALGLNRRRVQKLLAAGAPDTDDDTANQDWAAWETTWRRWIANSPRWCSLTRRMTPPANLDAGHTTSTPGSAPSDDLTGLNILEREKVLKARADRERSELELGQAKGEIISRKAAHAALTGALQEFAVALSDAPAHIAAEVPPALRDVVRLAAGKVIESRRPDILARVRAVWRQTVPELITTGKN